MYVGQVDHENWGWVKKMILFVSTYNIVREMIINSTQCVIALITVDLICIVQYLSIIRIQQINHDVCLPERYPHTTNDTFGID